MGRCVVFSLQGGAGRIALKRVTLAATLLAVLAFNAWNAAMARTAHASPRAESAWLIPIDGPIGPATSHYVAKQIAAAEAARSSLIILRIDTPGGLARAMREIVQAILASPVPVVGYVSPHGARAASAGTYILYATHIAAMAPATHLGAATPVSLGGAASPAGPGKTGNGQGTPEDMSSQAAERRKIVNDAVAFIRSLARQRGRNADWAEAAVRRGVSLTATQALEKNVIDLIAGNRAELLAQLDGMRVQTVAGVRTLHIVQSEPDWRTRLLAVIAQPTVAYLLLLIGIFGLLIEGLVPGTVLPGVVGGICLLTALYAFQVLPVNYAGLGLMALGVALLVGEAFAPSFGVLGLGGVAAFAVGSIMLMDSDVPGFEIPLGLIIGISIGFALLVLLVIIMFARSRRHRIYTGGRGLVGTQCQAMADFDKEGRVWLHGESWLARCDTPVRKNDVLEVIGVSGLTVKVRPVGQPSNS